MVLTNEKFRRRYAVNELHSCARILRQELISDWLPDNLVDAEVRSGLSPGEQEFQKFGSSPCAHEVDVCLVGLIRWRHIGPVLGVMLGIDDRKYCVMHVSERCAPGDVQKVEFHGLAVW